MGDPFPKIAPSHGRSGRHLIHDFLGHSEPTIQTASRPVQPFFTQVTAVFLYFTREPLSAKIAFPMEWAIWTPV